MNGAGNAILVLDLRGSPARLTPEDARAIHRAPGLGYDQMMVLSDPRTPGTAAGVLIYNNDGTLAGACGNGTRCVADRLCRELGLDAVTIETEAGVIACERLGPWFYRVDMGAPRLEWDAIPLRHAAPDTRRVKLWHDSEGLAELGPASVVSMGNPHAVFFVPDLSRIDAAELGPRIEADPMFPEKANVTFAQVLARDAVKRVCGSAASALPSPVARPPARPSSRDRALGSWSAREPCVCRAATSSSNGALRTTMC